jgi:subtilase family serine protease
VPRQLALAVLLLCFAAEGSLAQTLTPSFTRRLITQPVDRSRLVALPGNTRPEANAMNDRGIVPDGWPMEHIQLLLRLPAEKQQELDQLIRDQEDQKSPQYHKWLTPSQFEQRFSLAREDFDEITKWLRSEGFVVNTVNPRSLDFSGAAGQVREAFHTEIHNLDVDGVKHIANMSDPQIPAALTPAVIGVVSLNDFKPRALNHRRTSDLATGSLSNFVAPADLATIYNLNPLFAANYSGQGQTIVVLEDTDSFTTDDWYTFRSAFGLSTAFPLGSLSVIHPSPLSGTNNCADPGVLPADPDTEAEAILDTEWASAAAPSATIELASCADTTTNFGGFFALENILNGSGAPPAIVSISFGESESEMGTTFNSYVQSLYQQGALEGVSIFVAAGDQGAASSDYHDAVATHGIAVSGFASTPFNVAVGGTDFGDTYAHDGSDYWYGGNNADYGSAKSYVPEITWNDSCASALLAAFDLYNVTYGANGFCNNHGGPFRVSAGGGGPSGCATGAPGTPGVVSGTCAGYAKPNWQVVAGNPGDGVRDIPDISLFAGTGSWARAYVFCWSDLSYSLQGAAACTGSPPNWSSGGGTSFAAPIMAGIQALINEKAADRQGNPDPTYYKLAATEYSNSAMTVNCNSTLGNATAGTCVFYDVTLGDVDVDWTGTIDCFYGAPASGTVGVLSTSNSSFETAYGATTGWDFATGIGSVNAYNLANNWPSLAGSITPVSGTPQSTTILSQFGTPLAASVRDASGNPVAGATVTFTQPGSGASGTFASANTATTDTSGLATSPIFTADGTAGSFSVIASVAGISGTAKFTLTNTPGPPAILTAVGQTTQSNPINNFSFTPLQALVTDAGGNPLPNVMVTFSAPGSAASIVFSYSNTVLTDSSGIAADDFATNGIPGVCTIVASVTGTASTATFSLANTSGTPVHVSAVNGSGQSARILTPFSAPFSALATDANGNPVGGTVLKFYASPGPRLGEAFPGGTFSGGATAVFVMANDAGVATSPVFRANSVAGTYGVSAVLPSQFTVATGFALTNLPGPPAIVFSTAGAQQFGWVGAANTAGLQATVEDASGNLISGAPVVFATPTGGPGGSFAGSVNTAITNQYGVATSAAYTANAMPGEYSVTASTTGLATAGRVPLINVDFAVAPVTPGTVQVSRGSNATVALELLTAPSDALVPTSVNLTCAVAVSLIGGSCTVTPAVIPAGSSSGGGIVLTIKTAPGTPSSRLTPYRWPLDWRPLPGSWLASIALLLSMLLFCVAAACEGVLRHRVSVLLIFALLTIAATGLMSCGRTNVGSVTTSTPSSVTVTSVAAGLARMTTISINVE